jgi:creatinine amidohydrolase/Fe(II)-dependent formamide hydrolase-like protein
MDTKLTQHVRLGELTSPQVSMILETNRKKWGVLLPIGAFEQHGPLLPLNCDMAIAGKASENLAFALADHPKYGAFVLPDLPYTPSPGAEETRGTISTTFDWMGRGIKEIIRAALRTPWSFVVIVNGHAHNHGRVIEASMAGSEGALGRKVPVVVINLYEYIHLARELGLDPGSHAGEFELALYHYYEGYIPPQDIALEMNSLRERPPLVYGLDILHRSHQGIISPRPPVISRALSQADALGKALDEVIRQHLIANLDVYFSEWVDPT